VDNCAGAWVNMWIYTIHNCVATNNFSNVHSVNNSGTACVVTNTTYVAGQNWPPAAQAIIQNAGLEPAYAASSLTGTAVNDDATNCVYHGSWSFSAEPASGDYDGEVCLSTNAGDYVDFTFYGSGISALCRGGTNGGTVGVYLDGAWQTTASTAAAGPQPQQTIFTTNNLAVQTHTLRLVNSGGQTAVDAFVVLGVPEIIVNDDEAVYDHVPDDWTYSSGRSMGDYHSDVHYTQNNGEYVQYSFVGPAITWIGELQNDEGNVAVYLDGVFQQTVNCYSTTRIAQQRLFSATNLSAGRHSLKLVKQSGSYLVVDAFAVAPTPPAPSVPLGVSAVGGTNQVTLDWAGSAGAAGYQVERATISGGPYLAVADIGSTNYEDTNLLAGTTYYYVIAATNLSGASLFSPEAAAATIPAVKYGLPGAPTALSLRLTYLEINLSWAAGFGATGYQVKRATISGGPYTIVATPSGTGWLDSGLAYGTTYYYVISAVNGYGESVDSAEAALTTSPAGGSAYQNAALADHPVGYWPLDLSSDTNTDATGNLLAGDYSGHGNVGTYRNITASGNRVSGPGVFVPNAVSFDGVTTYVDLSTGSNPAWLNIGGRITLEAWVKPAAASTYGDIMGKGYDSTLNDDELEMRANNGNYHGGVYNGNIGDQAANGGSETANWTYVVCTYDGAKWNLYGNGALANSTASTTGAFLFSDPWAIGSGTADGLSRCFTGDICQAALYTNALTGAQVSTHYSRGLDGQAPGAPAGLRATPYDGLVSLAWNPSAGATGYFVQRSVTSGGPYSTAGSVAGTGYVDRGLTNGATYYYVVMATNISGTSAASAEISATPVATVPMILQAKVQMDGSFGFSFTGQSNQVCVVEASTNLSDWVPILTNTSPDGQFTITGITAADAARFFRVRQ